MSTLMAVAMLALMLGAPGATPSDKLSYRGKLPDGTDRGRVQYKGQSYSVRTGDEIPGLGRVKAVTEAFLVVRRTLTDAEKQAREAAGLLAVDAQDLRIPNAARTLASAKTPPPQR